MVIKNFFYPKSIAIIGASDNPLKVGAILLQKAMNSQCKIIPVNPNHDNLFGIKCYDNLRSYSGKIDLAIIAIPEQFVKDALIDCGRKKIKEVIIISAGFSEAGEISKERELLDTAKKYDIRILGPNCFGVFNPALKLDITFSKVTPKKGNIAFISQSGALWSYLSDLKIGFSGFVGLGNMADLEFSDFIEYFSKDKNTKSIILYIEKLRDGKRFIRACKNCKKPIFVVKAGSSEAGTKAALSHTGSLATDYEIYRAAFEKAGVRLCETLEEALESSSRFRFYNLKFKSSLKKGLRAFVLTNAGGAAALASDYLEKYEFNVIEKPLDILGTALSGDYKTALESLSLKNFDFLLVILTPQSMSQINETALWISNFKHEKKKEVIALLLGNKSVASASRILKDKGVLCFNNFKQLINFLR
jgi:acyl-CoA synthetase (NDP forming)